MDDLMASNLPLKPPKTFEEQLLILRQHGLMIEDEALAASLLSQINYYRFTAYLLPFKDKSTQQYHGASFNQTYRLYEFDRKLRNLLQAIIEPLEILLKTKIAYYHGHKYGPDGYTNPNYFLNRDRHCRFMEEFNGAITKNSNAPFVKHHINKYNRKFPIWVATELFSLGMLSKFYSNMAIGDKKHLAKANFNTGFEHLESWLVCLTDLRNRCAHYMRLYFYNFVVFPRFPKNYRGQRTGRLFDIIYILQYLYFDKQKWNMEFLIPLEALLLEYADVINLDYIGFPLNWMKYLKEAK